MRSKIALLAYLSRANRYSLSAILAALDLRNIPIDIYIARNPESLIDSLSIMKSKYEKIIALMSFMTPQLEEVRDLVRKVKSFKNTLIIAGGPHPSADPVGTILKLGIDYAVVGEGEETICNIIEGLIENQDILSTRGIAYRDNGKIILRQRRSRIDINQYPPFAYTRNIYGPIEIMRGCPWGCKYCQVTYIHGPTPRYRNIENILIWCKLMLTRGLRDLRFIAPNSLAYGSSNGKKPSYSVLEELLFKLNNMAKKYNGKIFFGTFPSEVRPDSVDEECAKILRKYVYNKRIIIGAQSGSDRVLSNIGRNHSVDDVIRAVEILRSYGFQVDVDFIFGLPGESEEDIELTLQVLKRLVNLGAKIHAHTFLPLPGTPFAESEPGVVPVKIRKFLMRVIGTGKVYGQWEMQEKLANNIKRWRDEGLILTGRNLAKYLRVL